MNYHVWTNPDNPNDQKTLVSRIDYDREGREIFSRQYELVGSLSFTSASELDSYTPVSSSSTTYDVAGQVVRSVDTFGHATENVYDIRGLVIETRGDSEDESGDPVIVLSRAVYDANGRVVVSTDEYVEGETVYGTRTTYDDLGRVVKTERLINVDIQISGIGAAQQATLVSVGTILAASETFYDESGRVVHTVDQYGTQTHYVYDALGQTVEVRRQSKDENGSLCWLVTRTVYDKVGCAIVATDTYQTGDGVAVPLATCPAVLGTQTVYDDAGRVIQTLRLDGLVITLTEGATAGLYSSAVQTYGTTISHNGKRANNSLGQLIASVGAHAPGEAGPTTDYEYDSVGRQMAVIGPVVVDETTGELVRMRSETHYADDGRVDCTTTNIRVVVDAQGAVQSTSYTDAQSTSYEYDAQGSTICTTFDDGSYIFKVYDDHGRLLSESQQTVVANPSPPLRIYAYDDFGRLVSVTLPQVYDPVTQQNVHPVYTYAYDEHGNQVSIIDPNGHETRFTYDDLGRETSRTLPIGVETTGDPDDFIEEESYDELGRLDYEVSFEGVVTSYTYDDSQGAGGRLVQMQYFDDLTAYNGGAGTPSEVVAYAYDAFGRQVGVIQDADGDLGTTADQRVEENAYNTRGQLIMVTSPEGVIHYEYDAVTGLHTRTWTAQYTQTTEADATTDTHYAYDSLGRLELVTQDRRNATDIAAEVTDYVYDLLGNLDQIRLPNGVVSDYAYDSLNRLNLLRQFTDGTSSTVQYQYEPGVDNLLAEYDYTVAADGRRTSVTEKILVDSALEETTIDWLYDDLGRLTQEESNSTNNDYDYTTDYTYDLTGNRLTKTTDRGNDATVDEAVSYTYDANDRLLTETKNDQTLADEDTFTVYEYGANSNLANNYGGDGTQLTQKTIYEGDDDTDNVLEETMYSYNLQGRMSQSLVDSDGDGLPDTKTDYAYNAKGMRARLTAATDGNADGDFDDLEDTSEQTDYLIDAHNPTGYSQVLEEKEETGAILKSYAIALDIISQADDIGSVYFLVKDGHGSTRALMNLQGQIVMGQVYRFDAFGIAVGFSPVNAYTAHLYCGEQMDSTGMVYLRARYYSPGTGTFTTLDPFAGNMRDPQSLHKYLYCVNDTINRIDPSGRASLIGTMCVTAINTTLENLDRAAMYVAKQFAWANIETSIEMIIGNLIGGATGVPFNPNPNEVRRSLLTNFTSNLVTSGLGGAKWNRVRQLCDFAIRTVSDAWLGGQDVLWSAGMNLASLGVSEVLANYGQKILGGCLKKFGACFTAGTPVVVGFAAELAEGDCDVSGQAGVAIARKTVTKAIETIALGSRVVTEAPDHLPYDDEFGEPDRATWRVVTLLQRRSDGSEIETELLRPSWWIELCGLEVGRVIDLQFPELQTSGTARVVSISACPAIEEGEGRVVIARFVTRGAGNLLRVMFEGGGHLTGTTNHPVWSIDANAWKRLDELTIGERLLTLSGETRVATVDAVLRPADVFNIEVHGDHVYRLLSSGLLAHNADCGGQGLWYGWTKKMRSTKLTDGQKNLLRTQAREMLGPDFRIDGKKYTWCASQVHHVVPLEYAHLFPDVSPNWRNNLTAMLNEDHQLVSKMWDTFRDDLNGTTPTQEKVAEFALKTIQEYGDRMFTYQGVSIWEALW